MDIASNNLILPSLGWVAVVAATVFSPWAAAAPPAGENLVADGGFEEPLAESPWQAASGSLGQMLCRDYDCGPCYRRSGYGALRFDARQTDDIWAVQQDVSLPHADVYEVTFYTAGCNGAPDGSIIVTLGQAEHVVLLNSADHVEGYRLHRMQFTLAQIFGESGPEGEDGLTVLTIANPSLSGANVTVENVRLVARGQAEQCGTAEALLGEWHRSACDGVQEESWQFSADGSFALTASRATGFGDRTYYHGTYCVDAAATPAAIELFVDAQCWSTDIVYDPVNGACEWQPGNECFRDFCDERDLEWHGRFAIEAESLSLEVSECSVEALLGTRRFGRDEEFVNVGGVCTQLRACSGEGTTDATLWGEWASSSSCEGAYDTHTWVFRGDGTFVETLKDAAGSRLVFTGTYTTDAGVSPSSLMLRYTDVELYQSGWGEPLLWQQLNVYLPGLYAVQEGQLLLALRTCDEITIEGAARYVAAGEGCQALTPYMDPVLRDRFTVPSCAARVDLAADIISQFNTADTNGNGRLSIEEAGALGISTPDFSAMDLNASGGLSAAELQRVAGAESPAHSADTDLDGALSLQELLRVIQFYNVGGYSCAALANSEDGFLPTPHNGTGADPDCMAHATDYAPADGELSLSELLRAVQLYNLGGYTRCEEGDDGFCVAEG